MNSEQAEIAEILLHCEENLSPQYIVQDKTYLVEKSGFLRTSPMVTTPVDYTSGNEEIIIVSDLHIASGRNEVGVYKGTENFFADDSFKRFLDYANRVKKTKNAILIINGDVFDFLRVVEYPGRFRKTRLTKRIKQWLKFNPVIPGKELSRDFINSEYQEWSDILSFLGINLNPGELKNSITSKERTYGLKTNDYKSVWKLNLIKKGHTLFFESLALWLEHGNKLLIVKGNHDTEWYWLAIRNYFRLLLAENIALRNNGDLKKVLKDIILPRITFIDDSVVVDKDLYVEHGHRYDKFTMILQKPFLDKKTGELNIPFGSFFNRYLLNRVELYYPYLDKIRPSGNILPILMKENFPLALKILFQHIPYTFYILFMGNGRYIKYMLNRVFWFAVVVLVPLAVIIYFNIDPIWLFYEKLFGVPHIAQSWQSFITNNLLMNNLRSLGMIFLAYGLSRFVGWFQLSEPDTLNVPAKKRIKDTNYRIAAMGHTHNPGEYIFAENKRFYNTGTWIPVIEASTAEVREDKTYTFLHLIRDKDGKLQPSDDGLLQRWNDDAGRAELQVLVERK